MMREFFSHDFPQQQHNMPRPRIGKREESQERKMKCQHKIPKNLGDSATPNQKIKRFLIQSSAIQCHPRSRAQSLTNGINGGNQPLFMNEPIECEK